MCAPADPSHDQRDDPLARARELLAERRPQEADALAEAVLKRHRSSVEGLEIRAAAAFQTAHHEAARTFLQRCITLRPKEARFHARLAEVLTAEGRYDDALTRLARMRKAAPGAAVPAAVLGMLHRLRGDNAEARSVLERELATSRATAATRVAMAQVELADGVAIAAERFAREAVETAGSDRASSRAAWFVIGSARERQQDPPGAMEAWDHANRLAETPFDREAFDERADRIMRTYSSPRLPDLQRGTDRDERPLLIAGLPRSGTSLLEQILACHPQICGGGELPDLTRLSRELPPSEAAKGEASVFPEIVEELDTATATRLARDHLQHLRRLGRRARFVTNKNLDHADLLGLVWQLLPGARVIILERDHRDTGVSCYSSSLQPENHPWASRLSDIAHAMKTHETLMAHWREVLDLPMLTVEYESLVEHQESETRRVLEFLGLPFDEACLRHHENTRVAATLSVDQVRQPVYRSSIGRWRSFEPWLGELLTARDSG